MFGNKKNRETNSSNLPSSNAPRSGSLNTLVKGTSIKGDIHAESDIRVDGKIEGTLDCGAKVIIGPTGVVEGEIKCVNAVIEGRFDGNLMVQETLSLKETAIINGDAAYDKLIVQQGAVINAAIKRNTPDTKNGANQLKVNKNIVKKTNGKVTA
ncbi:MAG: polymer-forming cytoskeletal protein [Bacteroidota bacterium]